MRTAIFLGLVAVAKAIIYPDGLDDMWTEAGRDAVGYIGAAMITADVVDFLIDTWRALR